MPEQAELLVAKPKDETLEWLHSIAGELATTTLARLDQTLPWYRQMPASRRSAVGLVAQAGITSFLSWYENPKSQPWVAAATVSMRKEMICFHARLLSSLVLFPHFFEGFEKMSYRPDSCPDN